MQDRGDRFHQLLLTALLTAALTLGGVMAVAWAFLGREGLAVAQGWAVVRSRFVGEYDEGESADAMLTALVDSLGDRWSYYVNEEDFAAQEERRSNQYVGIGITVSYADERWLTIRAVQEGSPAEEAGLRMGELILAADGVALAGGEATDRIRGEEGTTVELRVLGLDGSERDVTVQRRAVSYTSVTSQERLGEVAYIRLANFYTGSGEELIAAVDQAVAQGAKGLVFDVRGNGGGYVKELTAMLDHLLPEGPIFRMVAPNGREKVAESDASCVGLPIAVLVDSGSYSAAEFFAAQLQETAGAWLIGEGTSGKGYSQQALQLCNGGALNLSTNRYTTGGGASLAVEGVSLDQVAFLSEEERLLHRAGVLPLEEDGPLQQAVAWLEGRIQGQ